MTWWCKGPEYQQSLYWLGSPDFACFSTSRGDSLAPGRCNLKSIMFKLISSIDSLNFSCEIDLRWMLCKTSLMIINITCISQHCADNGLVPSGNKPLPQPRLTHIYVCRQATSHYLSQGWPTSMCTVRQQAITWAKVDPHLCVSSGNKPLPEPRLTHIYVCRQATSHYLSQGWPTSNILCVSSGNKPLPEPRLTHIYVCRQATSHYLSQGWPTSMCTVRQQAITSAKVDPHLCVSSGNKPLPEPRLTHIYVCRQATSHYLSQGWPTSNILCVSSGNKPLPEPRLTHIYVCRQATSHYLSQGWPTSMCVVRQQAITWAKVDPHLCVSSGNKPLPEPRLTHIYVCHKATSHYLSQGWPTSMWPYHAYGITH